MKLFNSSYWQGYDCSLLFLCSTHSSCCPFSQICPFLIVCKIPIACERFKRSSSIGCWENFPHGPNPYIQTKVVSFSMHNLDTSLNNKNRHFWVSTDEKINSYRDTWSHMTACESTLLVRKNVVTVDLPHIWSKMPCFASFVSVCTSPLCWSCFIR